MKIDFSAIEKMVEAGASAAVILVFLKQQYEREAPRKAKDRVRKAAEKVRKVADPKRKPAESERMEATIEDTPRARLFREGKPALLTLGIPDSRAGALIVQWLKLTKDDDQLVLATILRAQSLTVAEAPSWILATLMGKMPKTEKTHLSDQAPIDWDQVLSSYKKFGLWSKWAGPGLDSPACRAPPEMLAKYELRVAP